VGERGKGVRDWRDTGSGSGRESDWGSRGRGKIGGGQGKRGERGRREGERGEERGKRGERRPM
jgi:hypothetical protein